MGNDSLCCLAIGHISQVVVSKLYVISDMCCGLDAEACPKLVYHKESILFALCKIEFPMEDWVILETVRWTQGLVLQLKD